MNLCKWEQFGTEERIAIACAVEFYSVKMKEKQADDEDIARMMENVISVCDNISIELRKYSDYYNGR